MNDTPDPIKVIEDDVCWEHLAEAEIGRLSMIVADEIEIFPVNFVVHEKQIYFRTAEGTKLFGAAIGRPLVFECDSWGDDGGWSIVARCTAEILEAHREIEFAQTLPLKPWVPTRKPIFVRLTPQSLSGREFTFGDEPDDYWTS